ncbi:MAG: hypothetical protein B6I19_00475 [Bacteroidetes bacterium 4572_114]|nr:MAG: hypothetical protein B6I19_00475 [Bacteroidetes bacterium 4572_114]
MLFLVWFYRAYENLSHRVNKVDHSKGWSIWAWFVPVISMYRPYNIMNELNKKTDLILVTISGVFILTVGIILAFVTILVIKDFAGKEELLYETEKNTTRNNGYA